MNDLDYGIRFTGDATGAKAATTDVEGGLARVSKSLRQTSEDAATAKARWDALNDAHGKAAVATAGNATSLKELDDELAVLLSRLDPAYRATKQFQDGQGVLTDGLKANLITQQQYDGALASLTSRFAKSGEAAGASALGTAQARRELIVLGHEAMTGNFSRIPGSFMVLANRMGATATMFGPITAGLVAVGAAGALLGIAVAHAEEFNRVLNSMQIQLAATGRGSMISNQELTALIGQMAAMPGMSQSAAEKTLAVFAQTHTIGAGLFKDLALLVNDFSAATGETAPAAAKKLATAFSDPAAGAAMLHKEFGLLTAGQVLSIEQMVKQNDVAGAQKALFDDLTPSIAGLATKGLTPLQKATNDVGVAWDHLTKSMSDSSAIKGVNALVVELVDSFAWMINHADQIYRVLQLVPIVGTSLGAPYGAAIVAGATARALGGGGARASGKITSAPISSDSAAAKALDDQATKALALGNSYSTLTEKAKALEVTQQAVNDALNAQAVAVNPDVAAMKKLGDQSLALQKAVADAWRAAGAEGTAMANERIASAQKLQEISIGSAQNELETQLKLKQITKEQYDEAITGLLLSKNYSEQIFVQDKLRVAVLGQANDEQKLALQLQLNTLKAQAQAIAQKGNNEQLVDENAALLAQQAIIDKMTDGINKLGAADLKHLNDSIAAQKLHNAEIGKTAAQIEVIKQEDDDRHTADMQREADAIEAMLQEQKGNAAVLEIYGAMLESLKAQIAARRQLSNEFTTGAQLAADAAAAKQYQEEWKRANDEVSRYVSDAIMRGFDKGQPFVKNFTTSLENAFKTMVLTPVIKFILSPVTGAVTSAMMGMGLSGAANASTGGLGIAANTLSLGNSIFGGGGSIFSALGTSSLLSGTGFGAGLQYAGANGILGGLASAGTFAGAGDIGLALGAALPAVGVITAGIGLLSSIFGGGNDNAQPAGPPSAYFTNLSNVTSSGLTAGQANYWTAQGQRKDGGQYSTGPGTYGAWTPDQAAAINASINSVFTNYEKAAQQAGLATDVLAGKFSSDASVAHTGATTADALKSALASLSDSIATALIPDIKTYQAANETLDQTFTRLVGDVVAVQGIFNALQNGVKATVDVSEQLVGTFGGLSNLQTQFSTYYNAFYTQAEKDALATKQVTDAFASLNEAVPTSREQFKALVDSLDLTTASGQTTFKVLMGIAPAFDQVQTAADAAAAAVTTLADQITSTTQSASSAVSAQISASQSASSAAKQAAEAYRTAATSMQDAITQLQGGSLSTLTPQQKLATTGATLDAVFKSALSGDTTALGKLPQAANDFLAASQAASATSTAYARDFATVTEMLKQAGAASTTYAGIMDYQSTLLDAQTGALQAIQAELAKPSPDAAVLAQQASLLSTISDLLTAQTQQLVTVNSSLVNQTGQLIVGNAKVDSQTGQIVAVGGLIAMQTGQVVAVKQSVLDQNNLAIVGNNLVGAQTGQIASTTAAVYAGNAQLVLGNSLVSMQTGQITATTAAVNSGTGQLQAVNTSVGKQTSTLAIGNSTQAAIKDITDANKGISASVLQTLISSAQTQSDALTASLSGTTLTNTLLQQLIGNMEAQAYATWQAKFQTEVGAIWKAIGADPGVTNKLAAFDQQYATWLAANPMPAHAYGGIASGWSLVGEQGPELVNFTSPGRVYTATQTSAALGASPANDQVVAELKALRKEGAMMRAEITAMRKDTRKTADTLIRVTRDGDSLLTTPA